MKCHRCKQSIDLCQCGKVWPIVTLLGAAAVLSGCVSLEPTSVRLYGEHVSHATQHFESAPTDYGYNALSVELHWQANGAFLDVAEGINLNSRDKLDTTADCYGGLWGPREVFTLRAGYEIPLKR